MKRTCKTENPPAKKARNQERILVQLWPHQRSAIKWMAQRELPAERNLPSGGLLSDQMGLGKTASILGLIFWQVLSAPQHQNLIVVPASLLHKWREEWFKHFDVNPDSILIFHGPNKASCLEFDPVARRWGFPKSASIILTTYGQVLADHKQSEGLPVFGCQDPTAYHHGILAATSWYRIVLDESHMSIQNNKAKRYAALLALPSLRRWAVTGTVYTNRWTDIAAICGWIGVPPYNDKAWWKECWTLAGPIRTWRFGDATHFAKEAIQQGFRRDDLDKPSTLSYILIRNKDLIRNLPSLEVKKVRLDFAPGELEAYGRLAAEFKQAIRRYFATKKRRPLAEPRENPPPLESSAHLFRLIAKYMVKLRQFCNHPLLAAQGAKATEKYRICISCSSTKRLKPMPCGHSLCPECGDTCLECFSPVPAVQSNGCIRCHQVGHENSHSSKCPLFKPASDSHTYGQIGRSTKWEAILCILDLWRQRVSQDGPLKVVIFSQWVSSFNLLEPILSLNGYRSIRFTGETTSLDERDKILQTFSRDPNIPILLCGLKVGGVGLDLIAANKAILLEPWFNLPVEEQAQDRLHRMGQVRPVQVVKLSLAWSLEDWLYDLQAKKAAESKWLIGEWNGNQRSGQALQFTAKELQSLSLYLCPSYFINHRELKNSGQHDLLSL